MLSTYHSLHCLQEKKKKWEPPAPPPRVGKKQRKRDAASGLGSKLPSVTPSTKCKLRLLKLERIKDYLLMEHEFVQNQEQLKPQDERNEEDRSKVRVALHCCMMLLACACLWSSAA
jgi:26S proteasome regulatory subunit T2